jgi:hypothetical protein
MRHRSTNTGSGGYPITLYAITAAASARPASSYITLETDYGPQRTDYWHGIDITLNARLHNALNPRPARAGPCHHRQLRHNGSDR